MNNYGVYRYLSQMVPNWLPARQQGLSRCLDVGIYDASYVIISSPLLSSAKISVKHISLLIELNPWIIRNAIPSKREMPFLQKEKCHGILFGECTSTLKIAGTKSAVSKAYATFKILNIISLSFETFVPSACTYLPHILICIWCPSLANF